MKLSLFIFLAFTSVSFAEERCPALAGEYVAAACPRPETIYSTTVVHQVACKAVGFQKITYRADGIPSAWGAVFWEPVGAGPLLRAETDKVLVYADRFYDSDSLYAYIFERDKATKETVYKGAELIDLLPNGNLFAAYSSAGMTQAMINMKNCR